VKRATALAYLALSPAPRAQRLLGIAILGLAPQALCCRSLRELTDLSSFGLTGVVNYYNMAGLKTPASEIDLIKDRFKKVEGDIAMTAKKLELVKGSGNVFRDLDQKHPDLDQFKAILATEIIKTLDREKLSVRGAQGRTGIAAADFSRIRNADLRRFTVDRLMLIINRLGSRVEVRIKVRPAERVEQSLPV